MAGGCLALGIPLATGICVGETFWRKSALRFSPWPLRLCLDFGIGWGIQSFLFFLWLMIHERSPLGLWGMESATLLFLAGWAMRRGFLEKPSERPLPPASAVPAGFWPWITLIVSTLLVAAALLAFAGLSMKNPNGGWDAWAIWNLKARFLYRGQAHWQGVCLLPPFSHPDYPLLLPGLVARCWQYMGQATVGVPVGIAFFFTFATVGLLGSALSHLRGPLQGTLAGWALLGTPLFLQWGALQYADIPMGFFVLASAVLLYFAETTPASRRSLLVATGMMAGFAGWTKNEGLLFALTLPLLYSVVISVSPGRRRWFQEIAPFLWAWIPLVGFTLAFKWAIAPSNDLLGQAPGQIFPKLLDFSRYSQIAWALFQTVSLPKSFFPLGLLAIHAVALGFRRERAGQAAVRTIGLQLLLMLVGYLLAYLVTPYPLSWHMATSLDRLLLQLWPTFLFLFFITVSPIDLLGRCDSQS